MRPLACLLAYRQDKQASKQARFYLLISKSVHNLIRKATHRRVLIGVVYVTLGEGYRGNTGQSDEDSTVL